MRVLREQQYPLPLSRELTVYRDRGFRKSHLKRDGVQIQADPQVTDLVRLQVGPTRVNFSTCFQFSSPQSNRTNANEHGWISIRVHSRLGSNPLPAVSGKISMITFNPLRIVNDRYRAPLAQSSSLTVLAPHERWHAVLLL